MEKTHFLQPGWGSVVIWANKLIVGPKHMLTEFGPSSYWVISIWTTVEIYQLTDVIPRATLFVMANKTAEP